MVALFINLTREFLIMSIQVFSSLTADQDYTIYAKPLQKGAPSVVKVVGGKPMVVKIKGGNGIANEYIQTPKGVCTEVTSEAYEMLKTCPMFKRHVENGFIVAYEKKTETAEAMEGMEQKDGSAPLTPTDFAADKAPTLTAQAQ